MHLFSHADYIILEAGEIALGYCCCEKEWIGQENVENHCRRQCRVVRVIKWQGRRSRGLGVM